MGLFCCKLSSTQLKIFERPCSALPYAQTGSRDGPRHITCLNDGYLACNLVEPYQLTKLASVSGIYTFFRRRQNRSIKKERNWKNFRIQQEPCGCFHVANMRFILPQFTFVRLRHSGSMHHYAGRSFKNQLHLERMGDISRIVSTTVFHFQSRGTPPYRNNCVPIL